MNRLCHALALTLAAITLALPASAAVDIEVVETPGGATAWLVEDNSIPFVAMEVHFRGGTSLDAPGKRGATTLMTSLLEEGSGDLDARGFAEARDDLAAGISFDASDDAVSVSVRFLSDTADQTMDLLARALSAPRFDQDAMDRVRAQLISIRRSDAEDPDSIASETFARLAYGDHPYATEGMGTPDTLAALTRDDIVAAHAGALARDRVYIGVAGDISAEALAPLIDRLLAGLPETGAALPGPATLALDGSVTVVPFDTPQSVIQFAQPGLSRDDPRFFPAFVMNNILGGSGFGSRLMTEVREKRGLTYGIYAYLLEKDYADLFVGRAATANARASETVQVVRDEWRRMAEEGPTEDELTRAKTYLTGAYPLRFDGNETIARIVAGMQMSGLPLDYIKTRNARIEAVTLDDVRQVAAEFLDPDALTFVIVGQPAGL